MRNILIHHPVRIVTVIVLAALAVGIVVRQLWHSPLPDGTPAPQMHLLSDSNSVQAAGNADGLANLPQMKGKVVLIDFWATWCGPCQMATPVLESLYKKYHSQGLNVVGFSVDDSSTVGKVPAFIKQFGITYRIVTGGDANQQIAGKFNVTGLPTQFLIDRHGIIRWSQPGYSDDESQVLDQKIRELLRES